MKRKISVGTVLLLEALVLIIVLVFNLCISWGFGDNILHAFSFLLDLPSILLILMMVAPALLVSGMGKDFLRAFSVGKKDYTLRELERSLEAVSTVQKIIFCAAAISGMIALVTILYQISDISYLGPCMAVAGLVVLYAAILEFFLIPVKANVQNTITDLMDVEDEEA